MVSEVVRILLAEDNDGDVFLLRRALEKHGLHHELLIAHTGEEALFLLNKAENSAGTVLPDLIMLDLNLPRVDGGQVLKQVRDSKIFDSTPIIVLTSSDSPKDREMALNLGADMFFRKPTDLQSFMRLGQLVEDVLIGRLHPRA